jgi:large subunit ribosomal protein L19
MGVIEDIEKSQMKKEVPQFKVGDTVKVYSRIVEGGKERLQGFEGIVIKFSGGGNRKNFTVRRIVQGIGVERTFPLHSPKVERVEIIRSGKVRRAKLFYLRKRIGSEATRVAEETLAGEMVERTAQNAAV